MAALPVDGSPLTPLPGGGAIPSIATLSGSSTAVSLPSVGANSTDVQESPAIPKPSPSPVAVGGDTVSDATITFTTTHTTNGRPAPRPTAVGVVDGDIGNDLLNPSPSVNSPSVSASTTASPIGPVVSPSPSEVLLDSGTTLSSNLLSNTFISPSGTANITSMSSTTSTKPAGYTDSPFRINAAQNDSSAGTKSLSTTSSSSYAVANTPSPKPITPSPLAPSPSDSTATNNTPVTITQQGQVTDVALQPSPNVIPQTTFVTAGVTLTGAEAIAAASAAAAGESGPAGHAIQTDSTTLGTGAIIGIICGSVGLVIVLIGLCCFMSKRKLKKARNEVSDEEIEKNLENDNDEDFYGRDRATDSGFDFIDVPITPKGGSKRSRRGRARNDRQDPFDDRHSQFSHHGPARPDSGIVDPDSYYPNTFTPTHTNDPFAHASDDAQLEEAFHEEYRSIHGQQHWHSVDPFADHRAEAAFTHDYVPPPPAASYAGQRASSYSTRREELGREGAGSIPPSGNYNSIYGAYVSSRPGTMYDPSDDFHRPPETAATAATAALLPWLRDGPVTSRPVYSTDSREEAASPAAVPMPTKKSKKKSKKRQVSPPRVPSPEHTRVPHDEYAPSHPSPDRPAPRPMMAQTPAYSGEGGWQGVIPNFR